MADRRYGYLWKTETFRSWDELIKFQSKVRNRWGGWIYRGQRNAKWLLKPTLERAVRDRFKLPWSKVLDVEKGLIRRFQRQVHLLQPSLDYSDFTLMEWLALMQHHGAPTRLLDWTYSFFAAVFFAVEFADPGDLCAVWCFDQPWWADRAKERLPKEIRDRLNVDQFAKEDGTVQAILRREPPLLTVYPLNPFRLNQRLVLQQGAFLVPGNIGTSFMENLKNLDSPHQPGHLVRVELKCNRLFLVDALTGLYSMNVNRATLFPDLDGFARHLESLVVMPRLRAVDSARKVRR